MGSGVLTLVIDAAFVDPAGYGPSWLRKSCWMHEDKSYIIFSSKNTRDPKLYFKHTLDGVNDLELCSSNFVLNILWAEILIQYKILKS